MFYQSLVKRTLYFEVFNDNFDDPIVAFQEFEMVLNITRSDTFYIRFMHQHLRVRFEHLGDCSLGQRITIFDSFRDDV